jgi:hypothetical protein
MTTLTKIHLYVHPSELRLVRFACLVRALLGLLQRLRTSSLPISHAPDGDRIEHYPELSLTTPLKRLRVAPTTLDDTSNVINLDRIFR